MNNVVALYNECAAAGRTVLGREYEKVDHVLPPLVNECGSGPTCQIIQTAADQCETLWAEVHDRRGKIQLAVEPGLDRVLVRRRDVSQMTHHQRANMRRHDLGSQ